MELQLQGQRNGSDSGSGSASSTGNTTSTYYADSSSSSSTTFFRRLGAEEYHLSPDLKSTYKSKYTSDYDALCEKKNYNAISIALVFCSIDWFLLLIMGVYWHTYDKYQRRMDYDDSAMLWHQYTLFTIHSVPSKITWLGRIIGRHREQTREFFMHDHDAEMLGNFLINNVPWYSHLPVNQAGAKELMPRLPDMDPDNSETSLFDDWANFLKKVENILP